MIELPSSDFPMSLFDFLKILNEETFEKLGEFTFPMAAQLIGDSVLTFFLLYFIAKWVFDILVSLGKGGRK